MKFEKRYLIGLFLFIRMLQLSLDRALDGRWKDLLEFMETQPNIREVIHSISEICGSDVVPTMAPAPLSGQNKMLQKLTLDREEVSFVCWWLQMSADLLQREDSPATNKEISDIRCNLAYAEELVETRLGKTDRSIQYVEHYNQSEMIKCKSITDLVGRSWPSP